MSIQQKIVIGGRYRYYIPPTEYTVEEIILDATNEEKTGKLPQIVIYRQEIAGIYPKGTKYARRLDDFLSKIQFKGEKVNKFQLIENAS